MIAAEETVKKIEMAVIREHAERMGVPGKHWMKIVTSMLRSGGGTVRVMEVKGDFADVIANHPMGHILGPVQVPVKALRTAAGEDEIRRAIKNAVTKGSSVDDKIGTISMITEWIHGGLVSNHGKFIVTDIRRPVFTMRNFNDMSFTADITLVGEPDFEKSQNKKYIWNLKGDIYKGKVAAQTSVVKVFKPPARVENPDNLPCVFLAGAIDMGKAEDWQTELTKAVRDIACVVLNPRRDDWDSTWKQEIENDKFREQVEWELDGMEMATTIAMCFTKDSKAPISLLELGIHASDGKMLVFCPDGFYRKGNVDIVCKRYGVPVFEDFDEFADEVREKMMAPKTTRTSPVTASDRIARRMLARQFVLAQFQMVKPWTDAYGNPAQDYMQPLRRRPDYGETKMDITERVMGMDDNDLVTQEEVGQMCPMCAEKMAKEGLKAVRAYIIKAALGKSKKPTYAAIRDSAIRASLREIRKQDE